MFSIQIIDRQHQADIRLPNEAFPLWGRMIPRCENGVWSHSVQLFETASVMTFPDEAYDYDKMSSDCIFLGAYEDGACVGLAVLQASCFRYLYLYDLKVNAAHRRRGIAAALLEQAMVLARQKGYLGLYTRGQDNNLGACLFYLHTGFEIGGFDNRVYDGTSQAGKADILFYKRDPAVPTP